MIPVVLASTSRTRAALLSAAGLVFQVVDSGVDEQPIKRAGLGQGAPCGDIALRLARARALAPDAPGALVIGSDQTMELDGQLLGKPATLAEARERLLALRGRRHRLHTAVAVARDGAVLWEERVTATLAVRGFSAGFLDRYLARNTEAALESPGAYRLEGEGLQLFDEVEGDHFGILGLPLVGLLACLRAEGALER